MDIDLVYTYVNSGDEKWLEERKHFSDGMGMPECRFRDNDELLYSLRSVEKNAPWIRNIYIVTNSSVPKWLNTSNKRIRIIHHSEIMPLDILPCYDSNLIEFYIYKIKGLSDIFLYANDDTFFGNKVSESFFVKNNKPIIRMIKKNELGDSNYHKSIKNARRIISQKYDINLDYVPIHNIDVYDKKGIQECLNQFSEEIESFSNNRFRNDNDINRILFYYYYMANKMCSIVKYDLFNRGILCRLFKRIKRIIHPHLDFVIYDINELFENMKAMREFQRHPYLVCLNDGESTSDSDLKQFKRLMQNTFPEKSSFEV